MWLKDCSIYKPPSHPQGGGGCNTRYKWSWISYHPSQLWVHRQSITTLEHNQYTGRLSIQVTWHTSCGARFGRICKYNMPSSGWCVLLYKTTGHGCVTTCSTYLVGAWTRSDKTVTHSMRWDTIHPSHRAPKLCNQTWQDTQNHHTTIMLECVVTQNHRPLICCYQFHIPCGCIYKVWQSWDLVNTQGCCSSKPTKHPSCGTRSDENYKTTIPSPGWWMLLHEEHHDIDILPPIPFVYAWARSDKHVTQLIHCDPVHPSLRVPKWWDQIWWEL